MSTGRREAQSADRRRGGGAVGGRRQLARAAAQRSARRAAAAPQASIDATAGGTPRTHPACAAGASGHSDSGTNRGSEAIASVAAQPACRHERRDRRPAASSNSVRRGDSAIAHGSNTGGRSPARRAGATRRAGCAGSDYSRQRSGDAALQGVRSPSGTQHAATAPRAQRRCRRAGGSSPPPRRRRRGTKPADEVHHERNTLAVQGIHTTKSSGSSPAGLATRVQRMSSTKPSTVHRSARRSRRRRTASGRLGEQVGGKGCGLRAASWRKSSGSDATTRPAKTRPRRGQPRPG